MFLRSRPCQLGSPVSWWVRCTCAVQIDGSSYTVYDDDCEWSLSALPAGKPPSFVVERLDEAISENHARVRILGDTMSGGSEKTRQAMVAVLESAEHEVVVAALLAGTNALMLGYRTVLGPLGRVCVGRSTSRRQRGVRIARRASGNVRSVPTRLR